MSREPRIAWLFSLARCGSSVIAYAAAAPFDAPVADEVFGPWNRTGPPYNYPPEQEELRRLFWDSGEHLTPEVVALARRLFGRIAAGADRVVSKHPHTMIHPEEFVCEFPDHAYAYLLRNPLVRLNSLYVRGWTPSIGENHDLPRFKRVAQRWLAAPHRFTYEQFRSDPLDFFGRLWTAWGWEHTPEHAQRAVAYSREHYHDSSKKLSDRRTDSVLSERGFAVPPEAVELYLSDPFVRELMESQGWPTDAGSYLSPAT